MAKKPRKCGLCGKPETPEDRFTYDHIIPKAHGGPNTQWNLQPTHRSGNNAKGHTFTGKDVKLAMSRKAAFEAGRKMPDSLKAGS